MVDESSITVWLELAISALKLFTGVVSGVNELNMATIARALRASVRIILPRIFIGLLEAFWVGRTILLENRFA